MRTPSRPIGALIAAVIGLVALVIVGGWWFFVRDTSPSEVTLDQAVAALEAARTNPTTESTAVPSTDLSGPSASTSGAPAPSTSVTADGGPSTTNAASAPGGADGTWAIEESLANFVGFRIVEELRAVGENTVVGRTPEVTGQFTLTGATVTGASFTAELSELSTDSGQRDAALRTNGLETTEFPTTTFEQTVPLQLAQVPTDGTPVIAAIEGQLTLHGVTRPLSVPLEAQLEGDIIVVTGSQRILLADYEIDKPVLGPVLTIEDEGVLELQLFFVR